MGSDASRVNGGMGFPLGSRISARSWPFGATRLTKRYLPENWMGLVVRVPWEEGASMEAKPSRRRTAIPVEEEASLEEEFSRLFPARPLT